MWHHRPGIVFNSLLFTCAILFYIPNVLASPAACHQSPAAMFKSSDVVVEATVTSSKRWKEDSTTLHLVAKYRILDTFKGNLQPEEIIIVTDSCWDKTVPQEMLGYSPVKNYCLSGINLSLTGVDSADGTPLVTSNDSNALILFLKKDHRPGVPQQTWTEVSPAGYGGGCHLTPGNLSPFERKGFDRLPPIDIPRH